MADVRFSKIFLPLSPGRGTLGRRISDLGWHSLNFRAGTWSLQLASESREAKHTVLLFVLLHIPTATKGKSFQLCAPLALSIDWKEMHHPYGSFLKPDGSQCRDSTLMAGREGLSQEKPQSNFSKR